MKAELRKESEMKDSGIEWIGKISKEWKIIRIKRLSPVLRGASPRPIDDPKYFDDNGEFVWVRIADVSASERYLENTTQTLSDLGASLSVKRYPGDLFLSIAGTVGKPIITKIKCCIHDGFVYFPELKINPEFLYYIFSCGEAYKGLGKWGTQLNLNTRTVGEIFIAMPTNKSNINTVVDYLNIRTSKLQSLIDSKTKQIELLHEQEKSLIHHAVTKGLDPKVKLKDSGVRWIGKIPEEWSVKRIDSIANVIPGFPFDSDLFDKGAGKPLIRIRDIMTKTTEVGFVGEYEPQYIVHRGDLILGMDGDFICSDWTGEDALLNQRLCKIEVKEPISTILRHVLDTPLKEINNVTMSTTVKHLSESQIRHIRIPLGRDIEQKQIADYLNAQITNYQQIKNNLETEIAKLEEYKKSMIFEVVTGKVKVN